MEDLVSGIKSHTPGPWIATANEVNGPYCIYSKQDGHGPNEIAKCAYRNPEANARLIAQAPRMLDALKDAARTMKAMGAAEIENAMYPSYAAIIDLIKQIDGTEFYIERSKGRGA
jgi:hypothetical protein